MCRHAETMPTGNRKDDVARICVSVVCSPDHQRVGILVGISDLENRLLLTRNPGETVLEELDIPEKVFVIQPSIEEALRRARLIADHIIMSTPSYTRETIFNLIGPHYLVSNEYYTLTQVDRPRMELMSKIMLPCEALAA